MDLFSFMLGLKYGRKSSSNGAITIFDGEVFFNQDSEETNRYISDDFQIENFSFNTNTVLKITINENNENNIICSYYVENDFYNGYNNTYDFALYPGLSQNSVYISLYEYLEGEIPLTQQIKIESLTFPYVPQPEPEPEPYFNRDVEFRWSGDGDYYVQKDPIQITDYSYSLGENYQVFFDNEELGIGTFQDSSTQYGTRYTLIVSDLQIFYSPQEEQVNFTLLNLNEKYGTGAGIHHITIIPAVV